MNEIFPLLSQPYINHVLFDKVGITKCSKSMFKLFASFIQASARTLIEHDREGGKVEEAWNVRKHGHES